jgi:Rps23 Pro-64 3,4-dihydroxylase Tpa1-like proline 4-hydroxylase
MNIDLHTENLLKIYKNYLDKISKESVLRFFGEWTKDIDKLKQDFLNKEPFEHVIIDDFLELSYAEKICELFPSPDNSWHEYKNPIEVKYAFDNINNLPVELKNYFYYLSTSEITNIIRNITTINDLEHDEYLHGAGLHIHPRNGRLNIHLDYEKHPFSGKERRLNIILFMSKDWNTNWNGANELWNSDVSKCIAKTDVKFNRAILFKTNDISWHGLPEKLQCPNDVFRKSLAYYYVSPLNTQKDENKYRKKAKFIKRPQDPYDEKIEKLYEIRPHRRITKEDMNNLMPTWTEEM